MKLPIILSLLILCSAAMADAEIYKWTNAQGVVSYTDDLTKIPSRYRRKALKVEGLPIPGPTRQQEEKVLTDELTTPRKVTTPDSGQSTPAAPGVQQPAPIGDQPVPAPIGDKPIPPPLGDQPIPVPLGAHPAPVQ
ncbi:MAG: DUF4124 domain-containing protein [Desulfuromonadaceae bacterium]|nr:DUF4124 domain-containing protein [Desulfuromonadaceae bacterium]